MSYSPWGRKRVRLSDLVTKRTCSKILQTLCSHVTRCHEVDRLSEDVTGDSPGGPVVENPPSIAGMRV